MTTMCCECDAPLQKLSKQGIANSIQYTLCTNPECDAETYIGEPDSDSDEDID